MKKMPSAAHLSADCYLSFAFAFCSRSLVGDLLISIDDAESDIKGVKMEAIEEVGEGKREHHAIFQIRILQMSQWVQEALLDGVFQGVFDIGHLFEAFARVDERLAETGIFAQSSTVFEHGIGEQSLRLRIGTRLGRAAHLRQRPHCGHFGSRR